MTKKHFISLADHIRQYNQREWGGQKFDANQIEFLASFCHEQNSRFNRSRWIDYINGNCGPNGGKVGR